jgi:hypothetical protein
MWTIAGHKTYLHISNVATSRQATAGQRAGLTLHAQYAKTSSSKANESCHSGYKLKLKAERYFYKF